MVKTRKQDEFNDLIKGCDMCFFIFFTRVGEYTKEEFEIAYNKFKTSENSKPKIYVYFKNIPNGVTVEQSLKEFMEAIDKTYHHYYGTFDHIDTIKLRILLNIKMQEMDFVKIEISDNKCIVDGKNVLNLDNISEFMNSKDLQNLKAELAEIDQKYLQMKPIYTKGEMDDNFCKEYLSVASKRQSLIDSIEELQKYIFDISLNLSQHEVYGDITPRMKEVYRRFELGDSEGCLAILNSNDLDNEFKNWEILHEHQAKKKASIYIREHKLAIDILQTMYTYIDRFKEIDFRYREIVLTAEKYTIELKILFEYATFLESQNDYDNAFNIAHKLLSYYTDSNVYATKNDKALLYNLLGNLYFDKKNYDYSIANHIKAIEMKEHQEINNQQYNDSDLAIFYNDIGCVYRLKRDFTKSEESHLKALKIRERLAKQYNDEDSLSNLAKTYNNLGCLYYSMGCINNSETELNKALTNFLKANKLYIQLVEKSPIKFELELAANHNNLGAIYDAKKEFSKAEAHHLNAQTIRQRLVKLNTALVEPDLALSNFNLASLYKNMKCYEKAEVSALKAIEIRERLAENDVQSFEYELAKSYYQLGTIFFDMNKKDKMKFYLLKAKSISEKYTESIPRCLEIFNQSVKLLSEND